VVKIIYHESDGLKRKDLRIQRAHRIVLSKSNSEKSLETKRDHRKSVDINEE
jgi:hypothetical protein